MADAKTVMKCYQVTVEFEDKTKDASLFITAPDIAALKNLGVGSHFVEILKTMFPSKRASWVVFSEQDGTHFIINGHYSFIPWSRINVIGEA